MEIRDGELAFKLSLDEARKDFYRLRSHQKSTLIQTSTPIYSHHEAPIPSPVGVTTRLRARHKEIAAGKDPAFAHWLTYCR